MQGTSCIEHVELGAWNLEWNYLPRSEDYEESVAKKRKKRGDEG